MDLRSHDVDTSQIEINIHSILSHAYRCPEIIKDQYLQINNAFRQVMHTSLQKVPKE